MKKKIYVRTFFLLSICFSTALFSQEKMQTQTAKMDSGNEMGTEVKVMATSTGCDILVSPRDAASGLATGKRQHKPLLIRVSAADESVSEITSPRDVSSGMSTGKRAASQSVDNLTASWTDMGKKAPKKLMVDNGTFTLPDCPDGDYELMMSWSFGASNSGSSMKRTQKTFHVKMQDGACMAINEKGTGGMKN